MFFFLGNSIQMQNNSPNKALAAEGFLLSFFGDCFTEGFLLSFFGACST
jgi:hypothetical protein